MKITTIHYEACFNLGDYENEKIRLIAQLKEEDIPVSEAVDALRKKVLELGSPNARRLLDEIWEKRRELRKLEEKMEKRTEEWNQIAEFLKAQGLKADASSMPQFSNLLSPAEETTEIEVLEDDF